MIILNALLVIATFLLVIATFLYVRLTNRILQANQSAVAVMKEEITASVRPYVYFDLFIEDRTVKARLRNTGRTAAHKVDINTTPQLRRVVQKTSSPALLTHNTTAFLPPKGEIVEAIALLEEFRWQHQAAVALNGTVSYSDGKGGRYGEPFQINLFTHPDMA